MAAARETVLVTGASAGIGLAFARALAREGSNLILTARRGAALNALADELEHDSGVGMHVVPVDLAAADGPQRLVAELTAQSLQVDTLINNAGFGLRGRFAALGADRQSEMIMLNVVALTRLTRALLPDMIARGHGGVLNVGSVAGFQPGPGMAVYYATKAYVISLTEALAEECRGTGVRVSCLCPGPTQTEFASVAGVADTLAFKAGAMGAEVVAQSGLRGLRRGEVIVVPGATNKAVPFVGRLLPRWAMRRLTGTMIKPR